MPRHELPAGKDAKCSEEGSLPLAARFADWMFLGDALQLLMYLGSVWTLLSGAEPDRSVDAAP